MNWRKSVIAKKVYRYVNAVPRYAVGKVSQDVDYEDRPVVIANSFPKSGTHLVLQIAGALPNRRDWGLFLASSPSVAIRSISAAAMGKKIMALAPGELVPAHIYFSREVAEAMSARNIVHYFVYRDPRDVVVSETHYLTDMNRWHRMHKHFKALPDLQSRLMLSIRGDERLNFPNIAERFAKYAGWLAHKGTLCLRFEDLRGAELDGKVLQMVDHYLAHSNATLTRDSLADKARAAIDPRRSHTFRKGRPGGWRDAFSAKHCQAFDDVAGDLLPKLGYAPR